LPLYPEVQQDAEETADVDTAAVVADVGPHADVHVPAAIPSNTSNLTAQIPEPIPTTTDIPTPAQHTTSTHNRNLTPAVNALGEVPPFSFRQNDDNCTLLVRIADIDPRSLRSDFRAKEASCMNINIVLIFDSYMLLSALPAKIMRCM